MKFNRFEQYIDAFCFLGINNKSMNDLWYVANSAGYLVEAFLIQGISNDEKIISAYRKLDPSASITMEGDQIKNIHIFALIVKVERKTFLIGMLFGIDVVVLNQVY